VDPILAPDPCAGEHAVAAGDDRPRSTELLDSGGRVVEVLARDPNQGGSMGRTIPSGRSFPARHAVVIAAWTFSTALLAFPSRPVDAAVAAPTISRFSPSAATVDAQLTIRGTGFTGASGVSFNGAPATSFTVRTDSKITATVPNGALTGKLSVLTPEGMTKSLRSFRVLPTIATITPSAAPPGEKVTIFGSALTGATSVSFNDVPATFTVTGYATLTALVPQGAATGPVTVTTRAGTGSSAGDFPVLADLVLNEVNPAVTGSHDLVELLVVAGGPAGGISLLQGSTTLATLPPLILATGDYVVVHLAPDAGIVTEAANKTECLAGGCFASAWDVRGGAAGIAYSDHVLALQIPGGPVVHGAAMALPTGEVAAFPSELQALQAAGHWGPVDCAGIPCTYTTTPSAKDVSASWGGITQVTSVQRFPNGIDSETASDFHIAPSTFGFPNS
jgi:hypothetical protein